MKNDFFSRVFCVLFPSVIFIGGCASDIKDSEIKGAWLNAGKTKNLKIVGDDCVINIWDPKVKASLRPSPCKYEYKIIRKNGIWLKTRAKKIRVKRDSKGVYMDATPYWLGFIPMDNVAMVRKISDEKALEILRERGITKEEIEKLPLVKLDGPTYKKVPDSSYPKIMDKL